MRRAAIVVVAAAIMFITCSCGGEKSSCDAGELIKDGVYIGFENAKEYATPVEALDDGCLVIVSGSSGGSLYGGEEHWEKFLRDSRGGDDAILRVVHFIGGKAYRNDYLYIGGTYHYFYSGDDSEVTEDRPFRYLRRLDGQDGEPKRHVTWYVLTDSSELTYDLARLKIISSSLDVINSVPPYEWLSFTIFID